MYGVTPNSILNLMVLSIILDFEFQAPYNE